MLEEEVNLLLSKIENDLLEFVSFIKSVEDDYHSSFYANSEDCDASRQKKTFQNISVDGDNRERSIAIIDAFHIVQNVLLKISNLIDTFASLPTEEERSPKDNDNYMVSYYYLQYVYQIASYLVKTVEEHLSRFSEQLGKLSSPKQQKDDGSFESPQQKIQKEIPVSYEPQKKDDGTFQSPQLRKIPIRYESQQKANLPERHFKFKYSKPATVFTRDDKIYEHPQHYKFIHKHLPRMHSRDMPESSTEDDSESLDYFLSEDRSFIHADEFERKTGKILSKITHVVNALEISVSVALELLEQLKSNAFARPTTQTPSQKRRLKRAIRQKIQPLEKEEPECVCCECCESCKETHRIYKDKVLCQNKERVFSTSKSSNELYPILNPEPRWMQINPTNVHARKLLPSKFEADDEKDKNEISYKAKGLSHTPIKIRDLKQNTSASLQDPVTEMPENTMQPTYDFNKDARRFTLPIAYDNKLQTQLNSTVRNVNKIVPSIKQKKRVSTGELKPREMKKESTKEKRYFEEQTQKSATKQKSPTSVLMSMARHFPPGMTPLKAQDKRVSKSDNEMDLKPVKEDMKREKDAQASADSSKEPDFNRDNRLCSGSKHREHFGICCLHSQAKHQATSTSETNILVDKSSDEEREYPQAIVFDLSKFSLALKDKFTDHLRSGSEITERLEQQLIWDMVFDSIEESMDYFEQEEEVADYRKYTTQNKSTVTDSHLDSKTDKAVDSLVTNVIDMATQVRCGTKDDDEKVGRELKKSQVHTNDEGLAVSRACVWCLSMIESTACEYEEDTVHQKCLAQKSLKRRCFKCGNKRERGLTIHQCHEFVPSGVLEVRHMDNYEKICVCYVFWGKRRELEDWRWQKNPFRDPTRIEFVQETSEDKNAVLKVVYGPEGTMVKESLAETHLQVVSDVPQIDSCPKVESRASAEAIKSASTTWLKQYRKRKISRDEIGAKKGTLGPAVSDSGSSFIQRRQNLITKLGRLFDDIQKVGYGKGPPLVLKIRRNSALHDAYDLLMVPSKISLNYYRSLRVLFVEDLKSKIPPSSSNFIDEDQSEELFNLFSRMLFSTAEKRLFEHPSEETQCLYLNPYSNTHPQWFAFAGTVLALAFLHQKKMNIKLPLCLFKCLLDRSIQVDDLKEIDPMFYQKLMWMKENDITTRKGRMTFMIKEQMGNNICEKELIPNGREIAVTEKNKFRYIDLVVKWKIAERCLSQLKDFRYGFSSVLNPCFLTTFSEKELQSVIRQPLDEDMFLTESISGKNVTRVTRRNTD